MTVKITPFVLFRHVRAVLVLVAFVSAGLLLAGCDDSSPVSSMEAEEAPTSDEVVASAASSCGLLKPGEGLYPGESVLSCNGVFRLIYQGDGNLVLYDNAWNPIWSTATNGQAPGLVLMQTDGNLVVYRNDWQPLWSSRSDGYNGAYLGIQDDGNLVVLRNGTPLWGRGDLSDPDGTAFGFFDYRTSDRPICTSLFGYDFGTVGGPGELCDRENFRPGFIRNERCYPALEGPVPGWSVSASVQCAAFPK